MCASLSASQARVFDKSLVDRPQQRDAQHRVVRDQDVRRVGLHVPTTAHLGTIGPRNEVSALVVIPEAVSPPGDVG